MKHESSRGQRPLPHRKSEQPILAYRGWRLSQDKYGPVLVSVSAGTAWLGPVFSNQLPPPELAPDWPFGHAHIGIFAVNDARYLLARMLTLVAGSVLLYGRVIVHEHGYRAQAALIRSLVLRTDLLTLPPDVNLDGLEDALARRYQCEVSTDVCTLLAA